MAQQPITLGVSGTASTSNNTYLNFTPDTDAELLNLTLDNTPFNFVSMDDLSFTVEYSQINRTDDTLGLSIRIMFGGTVLAAADAGGTYQTVDADVINSADETIGPIAFGYVNPVQNASLWNAAGVEIQQSYNRNMGGDGCNIRVDFVEFTGNFTPQTISGSGGLTIGASSLSGLGEVSRVGSGGLSTAATLLSATGLTGATEARIEITWAEVNVPIAPANTSLGQGALVVPSVQIKAPSGAEAALTVPAAQLSGTGARGQTATADLNVPAIILASAGERTIVGSGGLDIPAIVMGATGSAGSVFEGTAALATGAVSLDSTGERVVTGIGVGAPAPFVIPAGVPDPQVWFDPENVTISGIDDVDAIPNQGDAGATYDAAPNTAAKVKVQTDPAWGNKPVFKMVNAAALGFTTYADVKTIISISTYGDGTETLFNSFDGLISGNNVVDIVGNSATSTTFTDMPTNAILNGVAVGNQPTVLPLLKTTIGSVSAVGSPGINVLFADEFNTVTRNWKGTVGHVLIWDVELTAQQIEDVCDALDAYYSGVGGLEVGTTLLAATGGISRVGSGGLTAPSVIMDGTGERIITGSGTAIPTLSDLVLNDATDTLSLTSDIPCTIYWARHVDGTVIDDSDAADIIAGTGTGFIEGGSFAVGVGPNSPAITFADGNNGIQEISFVGQTASGLTSNVLTSGIDIATVVEGTEPVSVAHLNRYVLVDTEPQIRMAQLSRYVIVDAEPQVRVAQLSRYVLITTV